MVVQLEKELAELRAQVAAQAAAADSASAAAAASVTHLEYGLLEMLLALPPNCDRPRRREEVRR